MPYHLALRPCYPPPLELAALCAQEQLGMVDTPTAFRPSSLRRVVSLSWYEERALNEALCPPCRYLCGLCLLLALPSWLLCFAQLWPVLAAFDGPVLVDGAIRWLPLGLELGFNGTALSLRPERAAYRAWAAEAEAEVEAEADVEAEAEVDEEVHVKLAAALTAAVVVARHRRALGVADSVAEPLGRALRGAEVRVVDAVAAVVLALRDVARAVAGAVADPARQAARGALAKLRLRLLDRTAASVPAECGMWGVRCGCGA